MGRSKAYGVRKVAPNMLIHELGLTTAKIRLGILDAARGKDVDPFFQHDLEWTEENGTEWALEYDRNTEVARQLKARIAKIAKGSRNVLWVIPSAPRMKKIAVLCSHLGERCWYTNMGYIAEKWLNYRAEPVLAQHVLQGGE